MRENLDLFIKLVRHPGQTVEIVQNKSTLFHVILLLFNSIMLGFTFLTGHFILDPNTSIFWMFSLIVGFAMFMGAFSGFLSFFFLLAKLFKESSVRTSLKIIGSYFLMAFTLYHIFAFLIITVLCITYNYALAAYFYQVTHIILLIWIAALCVQGVAKVRQESEFRLLVKVFSSILFTFATSAIAYLSVGSILIGMVIR